MSPQRSTQPNKPRASAAVSGQLALPTTGSAAAKPLPFAAVKPKPASAPPLRDDLRLHSVAAFADGAPAWAIQDPVTNRFFRIGWLEYECLLRWHLPMAQIVAEINANTPLHTDLEQIEGFIKFLDQHNLVRATPQKVELLQKKSRNSPWKSAKWWLHTYLFIRIPVVRPQLMLQKALPWVAPLFTQTALWTIVAASLLGLVLVARQWDQFSQRFMDMLSPEGLAGFALALIISKTLHELGHAFVATRLGLRVAHMGVAFVVLWPMLYTDTSESWRLKSHKQRLAISIAGVSTELALAGLATLAWALLDDGWLRQSMLYLATTGWILSLALNISPFMRFDGYFVLSDLLNFPNLHERAGALAKNRMRRVLLGLNDPDPEQFPAAMQWRLCLFAYVTWLYRLTVFLGIAFAVYYFFFKALGIVLLIVELWWFIAKPIWTEIMVWKERWPEVRASKRMLTWGLLASVLLLAAFPWSGTLTAPGVARAERQQVLYSPQAARVMQLSAQGTVQSGDTLAQLDMPDLAARQARTQASVDALTRQLPQLMGQRQGLDKQTSTEQKLQEQLAESHAIEEEGKRLHLKADFKGQWLDVAPDLRAGAWVDVRTPLGVLVDPSSWIVDTYVTQQDVERIELGAQASFWPQLWGKPYNAKVIAIDSARSQQLPYSMLDARHGGSIAMQPHEQKPQPVQAMYRVRLQLDELPNNASASQPAQMRELRGTAHINAKRTSWLMHLGQNALAVVIRESGF